MLCCLQFFYLYFQYSRGGKDKGENDQNLRLETGGKKKWRYLQSSLTLGKCFHSKSSRALPDEFYSELDKQCALWETGNSLIWWSSAAFSLRNLNFEWPEPHACSTKPPACFCTGAVEYEAVNQELHKYTPMHAWAPFRRTATEGPCNHKSLIKITQAILMHVQHKVEPFSLLGHILYANMLKQSQLFASLGKMRTNYSHVNKWASA